MNRMTAATPEIMQRHLALLEQRYDLSNRSAQGGKIFFSRGSRQRRCLSDWSSDVCSSDLRTTSAKIRRSNSSACLRGARCACATADRKSVVEGKRVDLGGRRLTTTRTH